MNRTIPKSALKTLFLTVTLITAAFTATARAAITNIIPEQDNTLAQELPDNSSGECESVFSGTTDQGVGSARRALLQFDLSTIPPGSNINSVTLNMTVTRGGNHADSTYTLHRVTTAWAEGTNGCGPRGGGQGEPAVAGSATWNEAISGTTSWTTAGGDFIASASASTLVNNTAPSWSSATMISEVQDWVNGVTPNFGWILIGDETNKTTARRFDSSEGTSPPTRPTLVVDFDCVGDCEACCSDDGTCTTTVVGSGVCEAANGTPQGSGTTCDPNLCPQPVGACCNVDNTCSDEDRLVCIGNGGTYVGGNCNQADCGLAPFVEELPIPSILQPTGTSADGYPQYTVSVEEVTQSVHPDLPDTTLWTYNGAWPAATFVATKGQPIEVIYQNNLPTGGGPQGSSILEVDTCSHGPNYWGDSKRIVTHLHGGHVPARFDGQPEYTILPGETDTYVYPNNQDAATVWYHDHALGITRLNVYGGMAGFYLIRDDEDTLGLGNQSNAFNLPSLQYEIGLAIQDRSFNTDGSLFYNAQLEDAFKGDYAVVNGKINPYLNVDQGKYRFRILNGSQSREFSYRLENITNPGTDPDFILIGTDLGLIDAPINMGNALGTVASAERLDVIIDFAGFPAGTQIIMRNDDPTLPLLPNIMKFIVTDQPGHTDNLPTTLRPVTPLPNGSEDVTRYFRLAKTQAPCSNDPGRTVNEWLVESLDGPGGNVIGSHWDDLSDFPILGNREVWDIENPTNSMHPMHVHLVRFQILSKTDLTTGQPIPLEPWELNTWKDIVRLPANTSARIIMDFEDYLGKFPQHCHILDHEDHEMMRQFQTTNDPAWCNNDGTCDPAEDCVSCPADCVQVSGAQCGNGLCEGGDGENCLTCPADCAGKQSGAAAKQFCCGFDDGQATGPIGCGVDISDNRCIDSSANRFCRPTPRVSACCGDKLCEGQEDITSCGVDCDPNACTPTEPVTEYSCGDGEDNDCDGLIDASDPDCLDTDGDGLTDAYETNILGTDPASVDSDGDGLVDGASGVLLVADYPQLELVDTNGDGYAEGEQTLGTLADNKHSDDDLLDDGLEVSNGTDPLDPDSWPHLADGDCGPLGAPDGLLNGGDLSVAIRVAVGTLPTRPLELAHCDLDSIPDNDIDGADLLLLIQMINAP